MGPKSPKEGGKNTRKKVKREKGGDIIMHYCVISKKAEKGLPVKEEKGNRGNLGSLAYKV